MDVFPALLAELQDGPEDNEHGTVAVTHESEWCIQASRDGYVVFENLEAGDPRHMSGLSSDAIIGLWTRLARGDIDSLEQENWLDGY